MSSVDERERAVVVVQVPGQVPGELVEWIGRWPWSLILLAQPTSTITCGIDGSEKRHDLAMVDEHGALVAVADLTHDPKSPGALPPHRWMVAVIGALVSAALAAAVVVLLRSARHDTDRTDERGVALRGLLTEYGDGVSLASGDPVGRPESWPDTVRGWRAQAARYGWTPAVLSASATGARVYADQGLRVHPTFYVDFPAETSPLTRRHRSVPDLVERWDLMVVGMQLGTAYSELTDAAEQRRRLVAQSLRAAAGDVEAMQVDEQVLHASELGPPPTGGLGLGVDRLAMVLLGTPIRGVLSFPFVKPLG